MTAQQQTRVLLVEDNPTDALLLKEAFADVTDCEFQTTHVTRLADAIARLREEVFDVVVLDLGLPDSQGVETFVQLHSAAPHLPVLVLTGLENEEVGTSAIGLGAQDYLIKKQAQSSLLARSIRYSIERQRVAVELDRRAQQLAESETRIRTVIDAAVDAAIIADKSGMTLFANPAAEQMFGRDAQDWLRRPFEYPLIAGQVTELDMRHPDGTTGIVEMRVVETKWQDQIAYLASLRDISAHKQAQEEIQKLNTDLEKRVRERTEELAIATEHAEESDRLKSEFLANMSHELRTPLNAIIGFSELLHGGKVGPVSEQHEEFLGDILTSARHLLGLINDILDLAKVEAGGMEFFPEPIELHKVVSETCVVLRGMTAKKQICIETSIAPEIDAAVLDAGKLKQVLYNFLSNAIKFTPDRGRISVRVAPEGADQFRLEVRDNGIGIDPEDMGKIFGKFQQLNAGAAKQYPGTGLGLALTKKIVERQGGSVGVTSVHGKGSTFFAILPRDFSSPPSLEITGS